MKLNENYRIESDSVGATLIYEDSRTRLKDGKEVDYVYTDKWYFLNMEQALTKYVDLMMGTAKDIEDLLTIIKQLKHDINKIKR
jgi:hypothetical protein